MVLDAGRRTITESEIIEFATRYDPQWFHTDPARAAGSRWQGLIASGWHTCSVAMQLLVQNVLADSESTKPCNDARLRGGESVRRVLSGSTVGP